jgi:TRAP-type mannitol/chloroaromatic compound transport system permease small subunit
VPIWPLKMLIPFGAGLLALQGLADVLRCMQCMQNNEWPARLHDVEELEKQILAEHAKKAEQEAAQGAAR